MAHGLSLPEQKLVCRQVYPSRSRRDVLRFATCLKCKRSRCIYLFIIIFGPQNNRRNTGGFAIHKKTGRRDAAFSGCLASLGAYFTTAARTTRCQVRLKGLWTVIFGPSSNGQLTNAGSAKIRRIHCSKCILYASSSQR